LRSIAFPAISTGAFGFPADDAADLAVATVRGFFRGEPKPSIVGEVIFCCFSKGDLQLYLDALD
jgi:O-acetyl-ADP-ribose deacetylase (regulator of RNase III)